MRKITVDEIISQEDRFYRLPKALFSDDRYKDMSNAAKSLYMILLDRRCLSACNGDAWKDEFGCVFIYFTIGEMMELLSLGNKKINECLKELEACNLLRRRHQGLGKPNKIYVYDLLSKDNYNWAPGFFKEGGFAING